MWCCIYGVTESRVGVDACGDPQTIHSHAPEQLYLAEGIEVVATREIARKRPSFRLPQSDLGDAPQQKTLLTLYENKLANLSAAVAGPREV